MTSRVDADVQLIEDLLLLNVVSIRFNRLLALVHEDDLDPYCDIDLSILEERSALLAKLSEKLKGLPNVNDPGLGTNSPTDMNNRPYVPASDLSTLPADGTHDIGARSGREPLYLSDRVVYRANLFPDDIRDAESKTEAVAHSPRELDDVKISNTVFSELFPTQETTKKDHMPGSFPDIDDFTGGVDFVGSGFSGLVFKSKLNGVPVVLKVSKAKSAAANRADYREWSVSEKLKPHPNVLRVLGLCPSFQHRSYWNVGTTAIISPWQENGGLRTFFDNRAPGEDDIENIALGMIRGIRSLHEQRAVHRDIAVRNFLVDCDGRVLLCDFGLTEFLPDGRDSLNMSDSKGDLLPWRYLAPESFDGVFSTKSDVWMYGIALIELLTNKTPWSNFSTPTDLIHALKTKEIEMTDMEDFPPIVSEIVRECLRFEPFHRPTADEIAEKLVKWQFTEYDQDRDEHGNTKLHRFLQANTDASFYTRSLLESILPTNATLKLPLRLRAHAHAQEEFSITFQRRYAGTVKPPPYKPVMINAVNNKGETPLMLAKNKDIQKYLLSIRRIPPSNEEPSKIAEYQHGIDVFGTLLRLAEKDDVSRIESLARSNLRYFAKVYEDRGDKRGNTPLHFAARTGNTALVEALLSTNVINVTKTNTEGRTALHVAALGGYVRIVAKLLFTRTRFEMRRDKEGGDDTKPLFVNIQDKAGNSALHLAAASGNLLTVEELLRHRDTKPNLRDASGLTPIFASIPEQKDDSSNRSQESVNALGRFKVLKAFLSRPDVDVNATFAYGETILHRATKMNMVSEFAEILRSRSDVDVNVRDAEGKTPLHYAGSSNNVKLAQILLSKDKVDVNARDRSSGATPLHLAAAQNNVEIAGLLLLRTEIDVNVLDSHYKTPLYAAAAKNSVDVAKLLLSKSDIDVNARGEGTNTPLHVAAAKNSVEVAELLVPRSDADVNARGSSSKTPFHVAVSRKRLEIVKILLSRSDVDASAPDCYGLAPLHIAAGHNSVELVKILLSRGDVDLNARDGRGKTPFHYVASYNCVEAARLLLSVDDVRANAKDRDGCTPLHVAVRENSVDVAGMLLERSDIDTNARDKDSQTPLHYCPLVPRDRNHAFERSSNYVVIASMLLSRDDVYINVRTKQQETPLHVACRVHNVDVVKALLLRSDVNVGARDVSGMTALGRAEAAGANSCAKLIQNKGRSKKDII